MSFRSIPFLISVPVIINCPLALIFLISHVIPRDLFLIIAIYLATGDLFLIVAIYLATGVY